MFRTHSLVCTKRVKASRFCQNLQRWVEGHTLLTMSRHDVICNTRNLSFHCGGAGNTNTGVCFECICECRQCTQEHGNGRRELLQRRGEGVSCKQARSSVQVKVVCTKHLAPVKTLALRPRRCRAWRKVDQGRAGYKQRWRKD